MKGQAVLRSAKRSSGFVKRLWQIQGCFVESVDPFDTWVDSPTNSHPTRLVILHAREKTFLTSSFLMHP
jgi:hypothetical protein